MTSEPSSPKFSNRTRCRQVGAAGTAIRVAMSEGTLRIVGRFVAVVVLSLVAAACSFNFSSPYQAYSSLTDEELVLVVPDTADWAHGDVCPDGGDCSGSMTAAWLQQTGWAPVEKINSVEVLSRSSRVVVERAEVPSRFDASVDEIGFRLWGESHHEYLQDAIDRGLQVWVGFPHGQHNGAGSDGTVLLFDDQGRVGAVGQSQAAFAAEPLVRLADQAGKTPWQLFEPLVVGPEPQRLLESTDPGLEQTTFGPTRIFRRNSCLHFGRNGPILVFPENVVSESTGSEGGLQVIDGWSGLDFIPFRGSIGDNRILITGQATTIESLNVNAWLVCGGDAIFVNQLEIVPAS